MGDTRDTTALSGRIPHFTSNESEVAMARTRPGLLGKSRLGWRGGTNIWRLESDPLGKTDRRPC